MSSVVSSFQVIPHKYQTRTLKNNHASDILRKLNNGRKESAKHCDVTIVVESSVFPVHKCVVSAFSEFYEKIFSSEMKEKKENVVHMHGVSEAAMEIIIEFAYTSEITINNENVCDVLVAADYMHITYVKEFCLTFMLDIVNAENCMSFKAYGKLYDFDELVQTCHLLMLDKFEDVLKENEFKELGYSEVDNLLQLKNKRVCSEEIVYNALIGWIHHDVAERKMHLERIFSYIKLSNLSRDFILQVVILEDLIVNSTECTNMLLQSLFIRINKPSSLLAGNNLHKCKEYFASTGDRLCSDMISFGKSSDICSDVAETSKEMPLQNSKNAFVHLNLKDFERFLLEVKSNKMQLEHLCETVITWIRFDETVRVKHFYKLFNHISSEEVSYYFTNNSAANEILTKKFLKHSLEFIKKLLSMKSDYTNQFLIFGGCRKRVFRYDAVNKELYDMPKLKHGRNASATVNLNSRIYVMGGYKNRSVEMLDTSYVTSGWKEVESMQKIRVGASSCVHNDHIYVVGGRTATSPFSTSTVFSTSSERYNFRTNKWTYISNTKESRCYHSLVCLQGCLYAIGEQTAERYDPRSRDWTIIPSMKMKRKGMTAVVLNDHIYAIGGYNDKYLKSVEKYNATTNSWEDATPMKEARGFHGACVLNGRIFVAGGNSDAIEMYDPSIDEWKIEIRVNTLKWLDCVIEL